MHGQPVAVLAADTGGILLGPPRLIKQPVRLAEIQPPLGPYGRIIVKRRGGENVIGRPDAAEIGSLHGRCHVGRALESLADPDIVERRFDVLRNSERLTPGFSRVTTCN